jgi:hypothetical protein
MKRLAPIGQPALVGIAVGMLLPFIISICLFSSTLQTFLASPQPTPSWSGAPTPLPQPTPSPVQVAGGKALRFGGGAVFLLGSTVAAIIGAWLARRRSARGVVSWLGAAAGALGFMAVALWQFLK